MRAFIDMDLSDAARHVLISLVELDKQVVVPDLLYVECANVAWKYVRLRNLESKGAEQYVREIVELDFQTVPSDETATPALKLALATGTSVYDASYAVVAHQFDGTLVTADARLVRKLSATNTTIAHLSEFVPA